MALCRNEQQPFPLDGIQGIAVFGGSAITKKEFMIEDVLAVEPLTVSVKEAAVMLGVCERTIRTLTKSGELPVIRIASRVLYSREDLIDFVRQRSKQNSGK